MFLEKEYSQENIEFWSKIEEYKKLTDVQQVYLFYVYFIFDDTCTDRYCNGAD